MEWYALFVESGRELLVQKGLRKQFSPEELLPKGVSRNVEPANGIKY